LWNRDSSRPESLAMMHPERPKTNPYMQTAVCFCFYRGRWHDLPGIFRAIHLTLWNRDSSRLDSPAMLNPERPKTNSYMQTAVCHYSVEAGVQNLSGTDRGFLSSIVAGSRPTMTIICTLEWPSCRANCRLHVRDSDCRLEPDAMNRDSTNAPPHPPRKRRGRSRPPMCF
jgi:hypothetical protein